MNREKIIAGLVGLILGILIAPVFTPMMWGWNNIMGWGPVMNNRNYQGMGNIDAHFIEQMIPHHEDAITMANLALTKAEHKEIKTLANDIIQSQSEEIAQMKEWYRSWFGKNVTSVSSVMGHDMGMMMHGGMMGNLTDIQSLEASKPFDKAFIQEMIPHHQMAVMMAQMLIVSTDRPEMKQLGENIISAQTKEINQMREWYKSWYDR